MRLGAVVAGARVGTALGVSVVGFGDGVGFGNGGSAEGLGFSLG